MEKPDRFVGGRGNAESFQLVSIGRRGAQGGCHRSGAHRAGGNENPNNQIFPVDWLNEETYAAAYDLARDLEERGIRLGIDSLSPGGYALHTLRAYETPYSSS